MGTIVAGGITQTGIFGGSKADKNKIQGELRSALEILVKNNIELIICEYFRNILEMEWAIEVALEYGLPVGTSLECLWGSVLSGWPGLEQWQKNSQNLGEVY